MDNSSPHEAGPRNLAVIVGLGETGLSVARYLAARGNEIAVLDSRADPPGLAALRAELPHVPVHLGGFDQAVLESAGEIVLSPGISPREPAIRRAGESGIPLIGDIELFARAVRASAVRVPIIGITGSNGKSTVTTLVAEMARMDGLAVKVGGNLGPPALALLDPAPPDTDETDAHKTDANKTKTAVDKRADLFVLELSSFQLETTTTLNPTAAALLNLSEDHMDRHGDMSSYFDAKYRIFAGDGAVVLNLDDPMVVTAREHLHRDGAGKESPRPIIGFTLAEPGPHEFGVLNREGGAWIAYGQTPLLPIAALKLRGMHNVANALAGLALGMAAGLSLSAMRETLREFSGLSHRCQFVADRDGVRWFNDSKATNVGATVAAVHSFGREGGVVLIAGGDGKGADFSPLRNAVRGNGTPGSVRAMVLLGRDAPRIAATMGDVVRVVRADEMIDAVHKARDLARPGDSVLLSPACASWDMYRDYRERGEVFTAAVNSGL